MIPDILPLETEFGLVRLAQPDDGVRIVQMVAQLAAHHGDQSELSLDTLLRDMSGENPWLYVLVAQAQEELVGYAALCRVARLQLGARGLELHHLFAESAFRGRGVGRSLVAASTRMAAALSCDYITLGTHPDNLRAQAFYRGLGFTQQAPQPRFSMRLEKGSA